MHSMIHLPGFWILSSGFFSVLCHLWSGLCGLSFFRYPTPLLPRAVAAGILAILAGGGPPLSAQETPRFPGRRSIDFWNTRRTPPPPAATLFPEAGSMPEPVKRLVEDPNRENAGAYLLWQQERAARLADVLAALEAAKAARPAVLLFSRPDCPHCHRQESLLRTLPVRTIRIEPGDRPELWERYGVKAVPTLVVGKRVLRGLTPRAKIEEALRAAP